MTQLSLTFFGAFRAVLDEDRPVQFSTRSARALLVYLSMHPGQPFEREHLAALLWPEASKEQAQTSLRQTLHRLRQGLAQAGAADDYVIADTTTVRFNAASNYRLDVRDFNSLLDQCRDHPHSRLDACRDCMARTQTALDVYASGFLTGFSLSDASGFEEWRVLTQERLHNRAIAGLESLAAYHQQQRDYRAAATVLQKILALEPWREETHLALMRAYLLDGKRHLALQQYATLAHTLASELNVQPSAESQAFYAQLRAGLVQPKSSQTPVNPYRGLNAFDQEQASSFFGREETVERLLLEVERRSLLLLVGVSGSGKSSLLHAGLLPALLNQANAARQQQVITLHPGNDAFSALTQALYPLTPAAHSLSLADDLRSGATSLSRLLKETLFAEASHTLSLVILIDQFEELFLSQQEDAPAQAFLTLLAEMTAESFVPHRVALVIALRADYLGQALTHGNFANVIQEGVFALGALSRAEMARAVELPAQMQNIYFEPGLVERLLDDVGSDAGRLPLLQFCLTRLWQKQKDGWISHTAYAEIEELSGALNHYADGVLARLNPEQQNLAHRVLLRLIHVRDDVEPSRRLGARAEFSNAEWSVVQALTNARLLVTDRTSSGAECVELVHESLIRNWARLGEWLNADRAFYFWREGLRAGLGLWEKSGRDSSALLRGGLLAEAEIRTVDRWGELSSAEADFIAASLALRRREDEARIRQQEQERERAEALAVALESKTQALQDAQRATALARSHGLVSAARLALLQRETDKALRLAQAALAQEEAAPEAELMLADAAYAPGAVRRFLGHSSPVLSVAFHPNGCQALSACANGNLILWNLESGAQIVRRESNAGAIHAMQVSPDGKWLLSACADGSLILWNGENAVEIHRWQGHSGPAHAICLHPDGVHALSAGGDKRVVFWEVKTGRALAHFAGHQQPVYSVTISPDGKRVVSGDAQGTVIHWELASGRELHRFAGYLERGRENNPRESHYDAVWGVAFRGDGEVALSASQDQAVILWDLMDGKLLRRYANLKAGLYGVALHPNGRSALLGRMDSKLSLLDLESGESLEFLGHRGRLHTVALTPDGRRALSGSADGTLRLWDLCNGAEVRRLDYRGGRHRGVVALALNQNETLGATATSTGEILLWDVKSGAPIRTLIGHTEMALGGVKFLPDSRRLLSASGDVFAPLDDFSLRLWDVESGAELRRFLGHADKIWDMALSPDGSFAVTASHDGTLRRWDLCTGASHILADVYPQAALAVAISPDGRQLILGLGKGRSDTPEYTLRLLDSATGQELHRLPGHTEAIYDVAFSPDGRLILSGGQDRRLLLWDAASGSFVANLTGSSEIPSRVAFSPDGTLACQGATTGKVLLWDIERQLLIRQLTFHQKIITGLCFSADGSRLYSADEDSVLCEWRIDRDLPALLAWIRCNRLVGQSLEEDSLL